MFLTKRTVGTAVAFAALFTFGGRADASKPFDKKVKINWVGAHGRSSDGNIVKTSEHDLKNVRTFYPSNISHLPGANPEGKNRLFIAVLGEGGINFGWTQRPEGIEEGSEITVHPFTGEEQPFALKQCCEALPRLFALKNGVDGKFDDHQKPGKRRIIWYKSETNDEYYYPRFDKNVVPGDLLKIEALDENREYYVMPRVDYWGFDELPVVAVPDANTKLGWRFGEVLREEVGAIGLREIKKRERVEALMRRLKGIIPEDPDGILRKRSSSSSFSGKQKAVE